MEPYMQHSLSDYITSIITPQPWLCSTVCFVTYHPLFNHTNHAITVNLCISNTVHIMLLYMFENASGSVI